MKTIKLTFYFLIALGISSCEDFLSEIPDNRTQIDTPEKISELLVNAYPSGNYMEFTETMTDNVFDSGDLTLTTLFNTQNYNWDVPIRVDLDTPALYWEACYNAIAHANQALVSIKELGDTKELEPQKGEALLCRAYAHFMLVSLWSKPYNPNTAASDLGIPYVLEPETVLLKKYKRNTVEEVFNYIEKDLEEGLKYVTNNYKQQKFHFTKSAANCFASRFYLIKGDWQKVIEVSSELGATPTGKLRDYQSYLDLDFRSREINYSSADQATNLLLASVNSVYYRSFYSNRYQLTGADLDQIFSSQTNVFGKNWFYEFLSYNGNITNFIPKYFEYFKITNANAGIGVPFNTLVLLSNDEFFLNRIEAHIMTNQFDLANAELQYFIGSRTEGYDLDNDIVTEELILDQYPVIENEFTPFYGLTPKQASYIKAIADVRRRDFIHEGLRWFDIRRFDLKITHYSFTAPPNILQKGDNRRVLQIPLAASNQGIEKNPR